MCASRLCAHCRCLDLYTCARLPIRYNRAYCTAVISRRSCRNGREQQRQKKTRDVARAIYARRFEIVKVLSIGVQNCYSSQSAVVV